MIKYRVLSNQYNISCCLELTKEGLGDAIYNRLWSPTSLQLFNCRLKRRPVPSRSGSHSWFFEERIRDRRAGNGDQLKRFNTLFSSKSGFCTPLLYCTITYYCAVVNDINNHDAATGRGKGQLRTSSHASHKPDSFWRRTAKDEY